MAESPGGFADELGRLADDTTELGLFAEDLFKNAAAALYTPEPEAAAGAIAAAESCARLHQEINTRALLLLTRNLTSSDVVRRVVEVQRFAAQFAQIATYAREIAEHALALRGAVDDELLSVSEDAPILLLRMLRQTYVEVRASVVACTTRDTVIARRVIVEDSELGRLYLVFKTRLERAITIDRTVAARFTRILLVGARLHNIGTAVVGIARTLLYTPPQMDS